MLTSFPILFIISTFLGTLTGLGVGGGSLLMLWLTLVIGMEHADARFLNLLFFLPAASISCLFRYQQNSLRFSDSFSGSLSGCILSAVFTFLSAGWNLSLLKKAFGILLIFTAIREFRFKEKNQEHP